MDAITGAVVIAGLTAIGKPTAEAIKEVVGRILSPSADAIGQGISVSLQEWARKRRERAGSTLLDAARLLQERNVEAHPVPGRLLMPILEYSSVEDDQDLHRCWTTLLANSAVNPSVITPAFPRILSELSSLDARIIQLVFDINVESGKHPTRIGWRRVIEG